MTGFIKKVLVLLGAMLLVMSFVSLTPVMAATEREKIDPICDDSIDPKATPEMKIAAGCDNTDDAQAMLGNIIRAVMVVVGIIAVIFIIYGGILYIISSGDATKVKAAKTVIQYSVIGLIIVILAYAIVAFVVGVI
jgi:hypothetical protein